MCTVCDVICLVFGFGRNNEKDPEETYSSCGTVADPEAPPP